MNAQPTKVGDVLRLERIPVDLDPSVEYTSIGIRSFGKGIFHYEPRPGDQLGRLRYFRIQPDRLILSNIKGWEGAIAVSSDAQSQCIGSNRFLSYVPADSRIDVRWARWYFLSESGIKLIGKASPGSADRNRTLAIDRFEALNIPLPPVGEQRLVAEQLDQIEASTVKLIHRSSHASALAAALSDSTAARPDLDEETKACAGWQQVSLDELLTFDAHEVKVESSVPYSLAGVYSFGRGMFRRVVLDGSQMSYKILYEIRTNQIVMSRLKAWEGALALVPSELEGWCVSPEFPTFKVNTNLVDPYYLEAVLTSDRFWSNLKNASKGIGARRERVNVTRLLQQRISIPSLQEQRSVTRAINRLKAVELRHRQTRERMESLIPAALADAFPGT